MNVDCQATPAVEITLANDFAEDESAGGGIIIGEAPEVLITEAGETCAELGPLRVPKVHPITMEELPPTPRRVEDKAEPVEDCIPRWKMTSPTTSYLIQRGGLVGSSHLIGTELGSMIAEWC